MTEVYVAVRKHKTAEILKAMREGKEVVPLSFIDFETLLDSEGVLTDIATIRSKWRRAINSGVFLHHDGVKLYDWAFIYLPTFLPMADPLHGNLGERGRHKVSFKYNITGPAELLEAEEKM